MEWAYNNATGAENYYIHSQFTYTLSTYSASSFQKKVTADTRSHHNLHSQVCTPSKTTHYCRRKEVSSLEQGRQKKTPTSICLFIKLLM